MRMRGVRADVGFFFGATILPSRMEDIFSDLVPAKPKQASEQQSSPTPNELRGPRSTPRPSVPDVFKEEQPDASDAATRQPGPAANGSPAPGLSREALQQLMAETVQKAVDETFSKFSRSLRTVLEDMSRRIEANTAQHAELKASLADLSDLLEGQAQNVNARFTSLDLALRDVDRGVQAMRDKQELHEAQAMLARFSEPSGGSGGAAAEKKPAAAVVEQPVAAAPAVVAEAPVAQQPQAVAPSAPPVAAAAVPAAPQPAAVAPVAASAPPSMPPHQQQQVFQPPAVAAQVPPQIPPQVPPQSRPRPSSSRGRPFRPRSRHRLGRSRR